MKGGAYHFLTKPFVSNEAVALVGRAAARAQAPRDRAQELEAGLLSKERFGEIIGTSARIWRSFGSSMGWPRVVDGAHPG